MNSKQKNAYAVDCTMFCYMDFKAYDKGILKTF